MRGTTELHAKPDVAWSKLGPVDQYAAISFAFYTDQDGTYMADALGSSGKLTEAGRLAYVAGCIRAKEPAAWAMCAADVAAFDVAELSAELRADTAQPGWRRMTVRLIAADLHGALGAHAADVKAAIADDPAYARMFDLAAQARVAWDARATQDAALRVAALAMDDARISRSRRALEGCGDPTLAAWRTAVGAIPAARFAGVKQIEIYGAPHGIEQEVVTPLADQLLTVVASDPAGYLASVAVATCDATAVPLGGVLARWPGLRGPRTAALTAMMTTGLELDREGAKIAWPTVRRTWFAGRRTDGDGGRGVILAVRLHGDRAEVEFVHKPATYESCDQARETSRIDHIDLAGNFIYQRACLKWSTRKADLRARTLTVPARAAAGLEPGMFADLAADRVQVAWAKPGAKLPSIVFGVPVK